MSGPDASPLRRVHRLLEHYTPDGTLGRLLLGVPLLVLAPTLFLVGIAMFSGPTSFVAFVTSFVLLLAFPPSLVLAVVCLWPVYLSLIGNVDSPAAYPDGAREASTRVVAADRAEATLKRRYADGEITREEFEARLDALFDADERERGREVSGERGREPESAR